MRAPTPPKSLWFYIALLGMASLSAAHWVSVYVLPGRQTVCFAPYDSTTIHCKTDPFYALVFANSPTEVWTDPPTLSNAFIEKYILNAPEGV